MKKQINKKGFLLGEFTLKVIIAVMCLLLLGYLFFRLYQSFTDKTDVQKADGTVIRVLEGVNDAILKGNSNYVLLSPQGWVLLYSQDGIPDSCQGQKCICFCQPTSIGFDSIKSCTSLQACKNIASGSFADQIAKCNSAGACEKTDKNVSMPYMIKADNPTGVNFVYDSKTGEVKITQQ